MWEDEVEALMEVEMQEDLPSSVETLLEAKV